MTRPISEPYRLIHFIILAFFITRFMPRDWPGLQWLAFRPAIKCGQRSLEVFCFGVFLAVLAHVARVESSNYIWMQILVSVVGIALMTVLAYYRSSSKGCRQVACEGICQHSANARPRVRSGLRGSGRRGISRSTVRGRVGRVCMRHLQLNPHSLLRQRVHVNIP
jgi:hypothetical protein